MRRNGHSIKSTLVWVGLILVFALGRRAGAQTGPHDLKALLPEDTLVVVDVRDVPQAAQKLNGSAFARFYADPRAAALFRPLRGAIDDLRTRLGGADPWSFLNGELMVAGIATGSSKNPIEWMIIARHNGDPRALERLKRPAAPAGSTLRRTTEKSGDYEIARLEITREELAPIPTTKPKRKKNKGGGDLPTLTLEDLGQAPAAAPGGMIKTQITETYEEFIGPTLFIHAGAKGNPLRGVLERLAGSATETPLARQAGFEKIWNAAGSGDIAAYANIAELAGRSSGGGKNSELVNTDALGLEEFQAAGAGLTFEPGRLALKAAMTAPEPRRGLGRMLFLDGGPLPDAAQIAPPEATACGSVSIDLPKLWHVVFETLQAASPMAYALVSGQLKGFERGTGLVAEEALANHLGNGVVFFSVPGAEEGQGEISTTMVALRGDTAPFRNALKMLLAYNSLFGIYHVQTEKTGAWPLFVIVEGPAGGGDKALAYVCVSDRWLLFSTRRAGIDAAVRRLATTGGPAMKNEKYFQSAAAQLPANRFAESVARHGGLYGLVQTVFNPPSLGKSLGTMLKKDAASPLGLSPRRLPESRVWDEYFGPSAAALSREDGIVQLKAFFETR